MNEQLPCLQLLAKKKLNKNVRVALLHDNEVIKALTELSYNLLLGNIPLKQAEKEKLKKYKTAIHYISKKRNSIKSRKHKILNQSGGFLSALIGPAIAIISSLLTQ